MTAAERVVFRPRKLARVAWATAALLVVMFGVVAVALLRAPRGDASFQLADTVAMFVLGLLLAGAVLLLTRARVEADATGIRVRNLVGETALPWGVVAAVHLDASSPWASLELQDDDTVALFALQANDGEQTVDAVLALRRLLAASRGGDAPA